MASVYHPPLLVKIASSRATHCGPPPHRRTKMVVVGPVVGVGNSLREFSKRQWGPWSAPPGTTASAWDKS
jgi:hypothetical protein